MLNYLNNSFLNSSKRVKIQLYLLPILTIFLIILTISNSKNNIESSVDYDILNLLNKKFDKTTLELVKQIEEIAKENEVFIQKMEYFQDEIRVSLKSSNVNFDKFLLKIEGLNNFTNIIALYIKNSDNIYISDLVIDFSKYYIKKQKQERKIAKKEQINIEEEKEHKNEDNIETKKPKDFKINAIVGDFAFINEKWIQKGSFIEDYKLDFVNRDYVLLKNDEETIKLEVNALEYIKNKN